MTHTAGIPTVTWNGVELSRLVLGHNPLLGGSHYSAELSEEMRAWHEDGEQILATLRRCEECGITTAQVGHEPLHRALGEHQRRGGTMNWIATFYGNAEGTFGAGERVSYEEELRQILAVDPAPVGIQHFGEFTDVMYSAGRLPVVREQMKWLRDTGLLVGVCTHLPEVVEEVESQGWDVDFHQTSFYTVYSANRNSINRDQEIFDDADRERMVRTIQATRKPCLAFKVLGGNRKCGSDEAVREALAFAYGNIKPSDTVCVGMWQKYRDQVGFNAAFVRELLAGLGAR